MFNFKYYTTLLKLYISYIKREVIVKTPPPRLWVELTADCNLRCVMCPNKDLPREKKGFMDFELFKKIVDEAKDFAFDLNLHHRGESLLHPEFPDFLKYATKFDWRTKLHTNGTVLTPELSEKIIDNGLWRISFSFDGYTPKTYEKIRVGAKFEEVVENIRTLLKIKQKKKRKYPIVAIELIDFPNSEISDKEKRKEFLRNFNGLGKIEVVVKKIHNWAGYMKLKGKGMKFKPCSFLWNGLVILWDGTVMPCAQDFFEYYPLENVKEMSIKEIWNGERLMKLREKHVKGDIFDLKTCASCDRIFRPTFFGVPTEFLKELLKGKMP